MKKRISIYKLGAIVSVLFLLFCTAGFAENIDPDNINSQYAWGENVGWMNLEPGGDGGPGGAVADDTLTGSIWAENVGWINLAPTGGGVVNDRYGNLSGYAWAENTGWVNFSPTNGGVTIDPATGVFSGYAWGENVGWISFSSEKVILTTSWRMPDEDTDGVRDEDDNCPQASNPTQEDADGDGRGDACDAFPEDPNEWLDTDNDGTGNNQDPDDDNDGMPDDWEALHGLNPLADDAQGDPDGDGYTNLEEYLSGTNPNEYTENLPPAKPVLSSPEDRATGVSLTPTLTTEPFSDPDSADTHENTQWQVSTEAEFSSLTLDITTASRLTTLTLPDSLLEEGTSYCWRVRFSETHGGVSSWSDAFSFTTLTSSTDADSNGIPDDQEVDEVTDLDDDGTPDSTEDDMKCVRAAVGEGQICTQISTNCTCIDCLSSLDPATIMETASRPESLPWGLISFKVQVESPGDTAEVIVYLSEPAPGDTTWYKYDAINGWQEFTDHASFSEERTTVTLTLTDGGLGDADGTANGIIVDPSGFGGGNISPTASFTAEPTSGVAPLTVTFDATSSHDPDGTIDSYSWNFGDGDTGTGLTTTHEYPSWGIYTASLTVTDDHGATDTATATITVTPSGDDDDWPPCFIATAGSPWRGF
jgi:chitodextrinase